ncbi:hypothetical protein [Streptomyces kebangsaanensis]|uniref:hypothetical protein n=1 Tax=Streptomyces kebangsaanensis TaxID=864058 RepID=UPI001F22D2F1|nr:hypothetical protein [Streptomyces kebangsaanensis]
MPLGSRPGPAGPSPQLRELKKTVRVLLGLDADTAVMVRRLACTEPGCPPLQTVVAVLPTEGEARRRPLHRPAYQITEDDLRTALLALEQHDQEIDLTTEPRDLGAPPVERSRGRGRVAVASGRCGLVLDAEGGELWRTEPAASTVTAFAWRPGAAGHLASGADGTAALWYATAGRPQACLRPMRELDGTGAAVAAPAWAGPHLPAVARRDGRIRTYGVPSRTAV